MTQVNANSSDNTLIRQAILAAQRNTKQAALLFIGFDYVAKGALHLGRLNVPVSNEMVIRLRAVLRDSDIVMQINTSHLAVLLQSITSTDDAVFVALKIIKTLTNPLDIDGATIDIRPRIGIALLADHSTNADTWIARAQSALELAKQTKQSYAVYRQERLCVHEPLRMGDLRQAIVADQLFLLYQPKIQLQEGIISGLEVLSRWQHPEFGIISPNEFIPVAERTGLIIPLTLWVLHQSLLQCRAWHEMGVDINIAVNLSMWNLGEEQFPNQIQALLRDVGISPEDLELEITESAIMVDPQQVMQTLRSIKDLGVRFTIDDFGTGYSSLAYLKKLPVSGIKIDRSFVQNMEADRDNAVIVRSIVDLGHNLGLNVVAEGVETSDSNDMLKTFQCDEAQGFYYSRPIPAYAITDFLKYPSMILDRARALECKPSANGLCDKPNGHAQHQFTARAKRA